MKYGFSLQGRGPLASPDNIRTLAQRGDELGYDTLSAGDHILIPHEISSPYPYSEGGEYNPLQTGPRGESMELLTLLAFVAGVTHRIRLVTSVIIVPYRSPLVAAKALATLDVLSQGRLVLGVGVGWMREEFEALEVPPFEERGAVTDEYIMVFKELWSSDNPTFEGKYCRFSGMTFLPQPVQKPHPPIWVGGESRPALRRTAELGDGWNPIGANPVFPMRTPEQLEAGIKMLATYARRFGRDPSEIEVIYRSPQYELRRDGHSATSPAGDHVSFTGNAAAVASDIRRYEEMGVSQIVFDFNVLSPTVDGVLGHMEEFADQVWPKV